MKKALGIALLGLCIPVTSLAAEPLGRLFFTPAQRSILDAGKFTVAKAPAKPGPRTIRLNGVVTRSDSERTVWINGTPYHNAAPDGVQVKTNPATPGSTSIRMQGRSAGARVKVGQQIDLNSGHIEEDYSRRQASGETSEVPAIDASHAVIARKPRAAADADTSSTVREKDAASNKREGSRGDNAADTPAAVR